MLYNTYDDKFEQMKNKSDDWRIPMSAINIILDEKDPQNVIFVEIETDGGKSINIGERTTREDGLTSLRITSFPWEVTQ